MPAPTPRGPRRLILALVAVVMLGLVAAAPAMAQDLPDAPDPVPVTPDPPRATPRPTPAPRPAPRPVTPAPRQVTPTPSPTPTTPQADPEAEAEAQRRAEAARQRQEAARRRQEAARRRAEQRRRAAIRRENEIAAVALSNRSILNGGRRSETTADAIRTASFPVGDAAVPEAGGSGSAIPLLLLLVAAFSGGLALLPGLRRRSDPDGPPRGIFAIAGHRIELAAVSASCLLMALFILGLN